MREIFEMGADLVNSVATKGAMYVQMEITARFGASNWSRIHVRKKF